MDEYSFLASLSPGDYTDLPGVDPERDAMIARLKARGLVTENIIGGVKLTPAGVAYLSEAQAREQAVKKQGQQSDNEVPRKQAPKAELIAALKYVASIIGMIIATVVAAWILRHLGW